jgi:heme-degrading monooxygenase HmoA
VYRIDKFAVPPAAMPAFMERLRRIQGILNDLPGCRQNLVLTETDGSSSDFNVVTVVEWASAEAARAARPVVQQKYAAEVFDPQAFMAGLGIRGDIGMYGPA